MAAEGGVVAVRVEPCSLLRVTGPRRRAVVARVRLTAVREAAHHYDGSVNAALLTAVAEALRQVLEWRGETIGAVTAAVPVGTPRRAGGMAGNAVSPLVVPVPVTGPLGRRLTVSAGDDRSERSGVEQHVHVT
jgi:hypothetical protein